MYAMVAADAAIVMAVARKDVMSVEEMDAAGFAVEVGKYYVQSVMVRVRFGMETKSGNVVNVEELDMHHVQSVQVLA